MDTAVTLLERADVACLTMTGPAGSGKTLLAWHLAAEAASRRASISEDGWWFVELAAVQSAEFVFPRIAEHLGLQSGSDLEAFDRVTDFLADRRAVLILDNFEHVIEAAATVGQLAAACPDLRIVVTSRRPLNIAGEHQLPINPFAVLTDSETNLADLPAVRLFIDRARAADSRFPADPTSIGTIAQICARADGLPLAIELAAARTRSIPLKTLLTDLEGLIDVPGGERRDVSERLQSLTAAIDWSYRLLSPAAQRLFRHLAVLRSSFTVDDANAVFAPQTQGDPKQATETMRGIAELVDHSLLSRVDDGDSAGGRWGMLETIRAYALGKLVDAGEAPSAWESLAEYVCRIAADASEAMTDSRQAEARLRLSTLQPNVDSVLRSLIEKGDSTTSLTLCGWLWRSWSGTAYGPAGRAWVQAALRLPTNASPEIKARALRAAAHLAEDAGDYTDAVGHHEAALAIWRGLGDEIEAARTLSYLGCCAHDQAEFEQAQAFHGEALALATATGDQRTLTTVLVNYGMAAHRQSDHRLAMDYWETALAQASMDDPGGRALVIGNLATSARQLGDLDRAGSLNLEALNMSRSIGDDVGEAAALFNLGDLRFAAHDFAAAETSFESAATIFRRIVLTSGILATSGALARVALARGRHGEAIGHLREGLELAARKHAPLDAITMLDIVAELSAALGASRDGIIAFSAAQSARDRSGAGESESVAAQRAETRVALESATTADVLATASSEGARMGLARALEWSAALLDRLAPLAERADRPPENARAEDADHGLTHREREVLRLLVDGCSDREIADRLFITRKTASTHVSNILGKLGTPSRTSAAMLAVRAGLT